MCHQGDHHAEHHRLAAMDWSSQAGAPKKNPAAPPAPGPDSDAAGAARVSIPKEQKATIPCRFNETCRRTCPGRGASLRLAMPTRQRPQAHPPPGGPQRQREAAGNPGLRLMLLLEACASGAARRLKNIRISATAPRSGVDNMFRARSRSTPRLEAPFDGSPGPRQPRPWRTEPLPLASRKGLPPCCSEACYVVPGVMQSAPQKLVCSLSGVWKVNQLGSRPRRSNSS